MSPLVPPPLGHHRLATYLRLTIWLWLSLPPLHAFKGGLLSEPAHPLKGGLLAQPAHSLPLFHSGWLLDAVRAAGSVAQYRKLGGAQSQRCAPRRRYVQQK